MGHPPVGISPFGTVSVTGTVSSSIFTGRPSEPIWKVPPVSYGGMPCWNWGYVTCPWRTQKPSYVSPSASSVTLSTSTLYAPRTFVERSKVSLTTSPVVNTVAAATPSLATPAAASAGHSGAYAAAIGLESTAANAGATPSGAPVASPSAVRTTNAYWCEGSRTKPGRG